MRVVQLLGLVDEVCKTIMHALSDIRAHERTKQAFWIDSVELSSDGALGAGLLLFQLAGSSLGWQFLDFERHIGNTHVHQWETHLDAILQCGQLVRKSLNLVVLKNAQPLTHGCISCSVYAIDMAVQTNRQLKVADLVELFLAVWDQSRDVFAKGVFASQNRRLGNRGRRRQLVV
jgi:hypothetical protein